MRAIEFAALKAQLQGDHYRVPALVAAKAGVGGAQNSTEGLLDAIAATLSVSLGELFVRPGPNEESSRAFKGRTEETAEV